MFLEKNMEKVTYWSIWALALFIFTSLSLSASHHLLIVVPGLFFTFKSLKKKNIKYGLSSKSLLVMILWIILSVLFNWNEIDRPVKSLINVKYFLLGILAIAPIVHMVNRRFFTKRRVYLLINTFMVTTSIATISGLVAILTGFNYLKFKEACHPFRACGLYGMTITYGYGISLFVLLVIGLLYFRKSLEGYFNEKLLWFALIINFLGAYFSYARGGLIAIFCGLISLLWFKSKKALLIVTISFIALTGFLAFLTSVDKFESRYLLPLTQKTNMSRIGQYQGAFYAFMESPFFGKGFRNFEPQSSEIKKRHGVKLFPEWIGHAHNNFLEFLAGCGLPGFLAVVLWSFLWLKDSLFSRKNYLQLFTPFIVGFIVSGQFQSTIIDGENMFLIMPAFAVFESMRTHFAEESL